MIFENAPVTPAERLWVWRLGYPPVRAFVRAFAELPVEGREHLPAKGPYVIVANHISWKDPALLTLELGVSIRYLAKSEAFDLLVVGFLLRGIGCFAIRRGEADRRALVTALRVLAAGQVLGFFPEGHRSESGALLPGKLGIAFLATRAPDVPIVPIAVQGTPAVRLRLRRRADCVIRIGPPFRPSDLPEHVLRDPQAVTDTIMRRIAALLPPEMRGPYG